MLSLTSDALTCIRKVGLALCLQAAHGRTAVVFVVFSRNIVVEVPLHNKASWYMWKPRRKNEYVQQQQQQQEQRSSTLALALGAASDNLDSGHEDFRNGCRNRDHSKVT